jgi:pyruvate/2-oxoglutarate dehydrogenase complex dihydrolipoamide acyltransferase (E2) component
MTTGAEANAVFVPREVVNADSIYVVRWMATDGARVEPGSALCEIETSKAVVTVEAAHAGYLRQRAAAGDEVPVGGVLGYITASPDSPLPVEIPPASEAGPGASQVSAKARRKIEELGLDPGLFAGRGLVREQDVLALAAELSSSPRADARGPYRVEALGPVQRRVARVLEESTAAVPAAYLERSIDLAPARERARALGGAAQSVVTEIDLLVVAVAAACVQFPRFNAFLARDYQLHVFESAHVGVAVDVGGDLYVVVVKDVATKSAVDVAKELRSLQYRAQRGRLQAEHLAGGTITVTSMLGRGVHRFQPIPYPQQAAIVGLADAEPGATRASLCLVFDHRVANGAQAAEFLAAVATALVQPLRA